MLQRSRGLWRKALCCLLAAATMGYGWVSSVRAGTTTVTLMPGSVRATVNGQAKTMLVPPFVDGSSQQTLVPIGFVGRQFGYTVSVLEHNSGLRLTRGQETIVVSVGNPEASLGGATLLLAVPPRGLLGEVLIAVPDVQALLHVQVARSGNGALTFSETVSDRVVDGVVDADAAGDIQENILGAQPETASFFQDRQQHVQAADIETGGRTLGRAVGCRTYQRLYLN